MDHPGKIGERFLRQLSSPRRCAFVDTESDQCIQVRPVQVSPVESMELQGLPSHVREAHVRRSIVDDSITWCDPACFGRKGGGWRVGKETSQA